MPELLFQFEDFSLDASRRELRRGGDLVSVEPQVFDLLVYLIRNRDRVVSKDDMIAAVWGGRIVSESALTNRINAARAALGDSGEAQRLIKTLQRKGIRFVGAVREEQRPAEDVGPRIEAGPAAPALPLPDKPSIAVLPFTNMIGNPAQEYFADGMAEEVITALSRCGSLFVIARNSSFTYKGQAVDVRRVGRELGVRYVLEGSVRRSGNRLRITGQLVDAISGSHIWADRFEGDSSDVFGLQDRITESVVGALVPTLRLAEIARLKKMPESSPSAYDLYLRGLQLEHQYTKESLAEALRCLRRAIDMDPSFAPALALAALCYVARASQAWATHYQAEAAEAMRLANRAIECAPQNAEVLSMSAFAIAYLGGDILRARELFARSLTINPNSAITLTTSCFPDIVLGETATMRERLERARRLSPRDPLEWVTSMYTAMMHMWDHEFAESVAWAEKAIRQNPRALPALRCMVVSLVHLKESDRAKEIVGEILRIDPKFTISSWQRQLVPHHGGNPRSQFILHAFRAAGVPE